jgi:hypothetical protein
VFSAGTDRLVTKWRIRRSAASRSWMQRETFANRLHAATRAAVGIAREYIEETLPDEVLFRVRLNSSYDGNPLHALPWWVSSAMRPMIGA